MSDARRYAVWLEPRSRSRSLKGSRPSVPHGTDFVLLVFVAMCSVFWLFWLSYHYLPSDWLEKLLWGSLIMVRGSSPESPGRRVCMIFLVYCIALLLHCFVMYVLSPAPTWYVMIRIIYSTVMARYSLFVLKVKVPLNPKQTNKQTYKVTKPG